MFTKSIKMNWINFIIIFQCLTIGFCNFCSIDFTNQNLIYLKYDVLHYPLMFDQKPKLTWAVGESGTIICNNNNLISGHKESKIEFECKNVNGNGHEHYKLQYKGTGNDINLESLKCNDQINFSARSTGQQCENGTLLKVGVLNKNLFIPFFDSCYDYNRPSVRYTKHVIAGRVKKITKNENESCNVTKIKTSESLVLGRAQLTPVKDGVFSHWKNGTMLDVNYAPEWQMKNISNRRRVENIARTMAIALNDNLEVTTGIAGILPGIPKKQSSRNPFQRLSNVASGITNVFRNLQQKDLQKNYRRNYSRNYNYNNNYNYNYNQRNRIQQNKPKNSIQVPKYFWKVLKYKDQYIAFITFNNPHAVNEKKVCNDICQQNGYPTVDTKDKTKGFHNFEEGQTYCCTIEELTKAFPKSTPIYFNNIKNVNVLKYIGDSKVLEEEMAKSICP